MIENINDKFMQMALNEAIVAKEKNEVPIGAIIIANGQTIARTHNLTQTLNDPTAHAEMLAITAACNALGAKYLKGCTIYVTVEPCPMCAAALRWAQIDNVVWATDDDKFGFSKIAPNLLHPKTKITKGVKKDQAQKLMEDFFKIRRK
ncbi:MAG: nucleoside deaminase [Rikenellaceae bacterium]